MIYYNKSYTMTVAFAVPPVSELSNEAHEAEPLQGPLEVNMKVFITGMKLVTLRTSVMWKTAAL